MKCCICDNEIFKTVFEGKVRDGGASSNTNFNAKIIRCLECEVELLDANNINDEKYWEKKTDSIDKKKIYKKYDWEQELWLNKIGLNTFRDKNVLDFGCGHAIFLDLLQNIANETYGIEKDKKLFNDFYINKEHKIYEDLKDIKTGTIDITVSFDVIEHLENPKAILKEINRVMKSNGEIYFGVPNQNDFLKRIENTYLPFFYHKAHLLYFNEKSFSKLLENTNFKYVNVDYLHKYNIYNMINWLKDNKPTGNPLLDEPFDEFFDKQYKSYLELKGMSSHIIIKGEKCLK